MLFMRHLKYISYEIECEGIEGSGCYMLGEKMITPLCSILTALGETNDAEEELSYLKYSKIIASMPSRTVDIAYPVVIEKDGRYRFRKSTNPYISVYFPTETESKIPLIIQGPYRTTPNRSSIPFDNDENIMLAKLTADLLYESVLDIKAQGQLSLQLLNILPLQEPEYLDNWLFKPLYDRTIEMFENEEILPTADGGLVAGKYAKIARGQELIRIFPDELLRELINDEDDTFDDDENDDNVEGEARRSNIPYKWLPGQLTENNTELSVLYFFFKDKLDIEVVRSVDLHKYLNNNRDFLKNRDDTWLEQFYKYLEKNSNLLNPASPDGRSMLLTPFVKTADDCFVAPFRKSERNLLPNVYMPKKSIIVGFQFVDPFLAEQCNSFFKEVLHLTEPDRYEYFKKVIERRYVNRLLEITDEEYIEDVKSALKYLTIDKYKSDLQKTLSQILFIRCEADIGMVYVNPNRTDLYFDKSDEGESTRDYFASDDSIRFVDMVLYSENGIDRQSLGLLGVKGALIIGLDNNDWYKPLEANALWYDVDDFRSQLEFVGIDNAITFIQNNPESDLAKRKSKIIMQLLFAAEKHLSGVIIQGKTVKKRVEAHAKTIEILTCGKRLQYRNSQPPKWLFDQNGRNVNPVEISKYDLDTDIYGKLKRDSDVYHILEFAHTQKDEMEETLASLACISDQDKQTQELILDHLFIKYLGLPLSEVKENIALVEMYKAGANGYSETSDAEDEYFDPDAVYGGNEFPSRPVMNLNKLRQSVEGQYSSAPKVKYVKREESFRISEDKEKNRSYLEDMYSCKDNHTFYICQMCKKPWLFFEAVQIEKGPKLELWQMHMLLCPNCAIKYRELRNDSYVVTDFITNLFDADEKMGEPVCVPMGLTIINFTATHIAEIKEIQRLNAMSKVNDEI